MKPSGRADVPSAVLMGDLCGRADHPPRSVPTTLPIADPHQLDLTPTVPQCDPKVCEVGFTAAGGGKESAASGDRAR